MDKYKNKFRIASARLQSWDYGTNGAYFITICTKNMQHFFGDIVDGNMELSEMGEFAEKYWLEIPVHFPFVELGNFVVMPNHTHGILIIDRDPSVVETLQCHVSTSMPIANDETDETDETNETEKNEKMAKISPKSGSISTIVRSYKSVVTKNAKKINADFTWQPRFYDNIIWNSQSFRNIQNYIANNPLNWKKDKFYKK